MAEIKDPYLNEYNILENKLGLVNEKELKKAESDLVIIRIAEYFQNMFFSFDDDFLSNLHRFLFQDIYYFAGEYRTIKTYKAEEKLAFMSVDYSSPDDIDKNIKNVFKDLKETDLISLTLDEKVDFISKNLTRLWKTHPFREGNTRTTLVFLRGYLNYYGITFSTDLFKNPNNYQYMREALVVASFSDEELGVKENYTYLNKVIKNILLKDLENKKSM